MENSELILIALLVIVVLYLLCYKNESMLVANDNLLQGYLNDQGILQIPVVTLNAGTLVTPSESYVVGRENCCGSYCNSPEKFMQKENCCGRMENYVVGRENMNNVSIPKMPRIKHLKNKKERFGSNPLDNLTDYDPTSTPFSSGSFEPFVVDEKNKEYKQERFEEHYISDNRVLKHEQYIPNPQNSMVIA